MLNLFLSFTIRCTVETFSLNIELVSVIILAAYVLPSEDCLRDIKPNDSYLQMVRQTVQNILADGLHNNLLY